MLLKKAPTPCPFHQIDSEQYRGAVCRPVQAVRDAKRELDVAAIELQVAELEAQREQILGKAAADVERMKNAAEAKGAQLLVEAFGSPQSYNLYTFAKHFQPSDLRLIFAGPGTFWTDLKSFEQVGASKVLEQTQDKKS